MKFWKHGQREEIARYVGIPASNLSAILHRKRRISITKAMRLELASQIVLKTPILRGHWIFNEHSEHPCFFGKPKAIKSKLAK